jgi:hypothetical protein
LPGQRVDACDCDYVMVSLVSSNLPDIYLDVG